MKIRKILEESWVRHRLMHDKDGRIISERKNFTTKEALEKLTQRENLVNKKNR